MERSMENSSDTGIMVVVNKLSSRTESIMEGTEDMTRVESSQEMKSMRMAKGSRK